MNLVEWRAFARSNTCLGIAGWLKIATPFGSVLESGSACKRIRDHHVDFSAETAENAVVVYNAYTAICFTLEEQPPVAPPVSHEDIVFSWHKIQVPAGHVVWIRQELREYFPQFSDSHWGAWGNIVMGGDDPLVKLFLAMPEVAGWEPTGEDGKYRPVYLRKTTEAQASVTEEETGDIVIEDDDNS